VVFAIDGDNWTLDLREGSGSVKKGLPEDKPDLTLTISDENFARMVMGKLSPQQVGPCMLGHACQGSLPLLQPEQACMHGNTSSACLATPALPVKRQGSLQHQGRCCSLGCSCLGASEAHQISDRTQAQHGVLVHAALHSTV